MKRVLKILNTISALFILAAGLLGPIYAVFIQNIGGDLIVTGTAYSIYAIASGILIFFMSKWEDHIKYKVKLMVAGYGLACLAFLGYTLISNPLQLFLVQLTLGIAASIRVPVFDALYSKNLTKGKYTSEWGIWEAIAYVFTGISAFAGGYIAQTFGFKVLFLCMFGIAFIGFMFSTLLLIDKHIKNEKEED